MDVSPRALKFSVIVAVLQIKFIIVFGVLGKYKYEMFKDDEEGREEKTTHFGAVVGSTQYPNFQDVNVMIFIGFGFLMTFLKKYGFSAVGLNLQLSVICIQWVAIVRGVIHMIDDEKDYFYYGLEDMVLSNFGTATVLISYGALLGKASAIQLLLMGLIEVVLAQVNEYIGLEMLKVADIGESMFIHMFGAYFGLAVAAMLYRNEQVDHPKEGSVYHSDLFAMIGSVFLWIYWPSFNGGFAGEQSEVAYVNTFLSLCACTAVTFALSALLDKEGRFDMVHVQNSTLAGGVAVGTVANMPMKPFGAMVCGSIAGFISVIGYKFITPFMASKLKIHDTCGVNNLHGLPSFIAVIASCFLAATNSHEDWPEGWYEHIFKEVKLIDANKNETDVRTEAEQGGYQFAAATITLLIAVIGGLLTGLLLKLPLFHQPEEDTMFDDVDNWELPEEEEEPRTNGNTPNKYTPKDASTESPM